MVCESSFTSVSRRREAVGMLDAQLEILTEHHDRYAVD